MSVPPSTSPAEGEAPRSAWYAAAMEQLVPVVEVLSHARTIDAVAGVVTDFARRIAESDGATFILREDGDMGHCVAESAETPQFTGRRFPLESGMTGRVILSGEPVIIGDINNHPWVKPGTYDPEVLTSLAIVPIRRTAPIGAVCIYWRGRSHVPTTEALGVLQALADVTSVAWENVRLVGDLEDKIRRLESQQAHINEQRETLEVFTHALAHDLREPVRTVRAFTDMIVEDGGLPESAVTYFDFVRRGAVRMGMMIDTVYAYTQLHDPSRVRKEACAMDTALSAARENLHRLIEESGATIKCDALPAVEANPGQMMQLFQNLLGNAIRHCRRPVTVTVNALDQDGQWLFRVCDDGDGISEHDIGRIFQPFKRLNLNEEGTGLGLAICTKIIGIHGGRIWCESKEGEGACFCFTLPRAA
ncbi:sensor histidine kinase [Asticcacaulis solisilvae]|uniref:sensor histidine kinase n=1 Tax=Asticcacaulis solisilvae TaxID=1217274 RepID=UPI003FD75B14